MLLYVLPVVFAVGGIAFPIGVLLYWTTSNLWTMGQQFYVIRNNPAPGTPGVPGEGEARRRPSAAQGGRGEPRCPTPTAAARHRGAGERPAPSRAARQQPKKQSRSSASAESETEPMDAPSDRT